MSTARAWPAQAYLDALRPDAGWSVRTAVLASYSADLPSIAAALLSLAGRDDERGTGGRADLAEAIEELRGKVRIIIQRGRLAKLRRLPAIVGILDQFLVEVPFDEAERSWHPKIALVCFEHSDGSSAWRLWLGSRNLTAVENRDFGMVLKGLPASRVRGITAEGMENLASRLAEFAALPGVEPADFGRQAGEVRWAAPSGVKLRSLRLTSGEGGEPLPTCPARLEDVILVSPFLDSTFVKAVGRWGREGTGYSLLSTHTELRKLAQQVGKPLERFRDRLLVLDRPVDPIDPVGQEVIAVGSTEPEITIEAGAEQASPLGLHAKILAARCAGKARLWVGSANATERAWSGRNVEVIAEIEADEELLSGLEHLLGQGRPVEEADLAREPADKEDPIRERLEVARKRMTALWSGRLTRDEEDKFRLESPYDPHPEDPDLLLAAGLATGDLVSWPPSTSTLELGSYPLSLHTEMVQFRLSLDGRECTWLQRCEVTPALHEDRDRAALSTFLGPRAFLEWMKALLAGSEAADAAEEAWDEPSSVRTGTSELAASATLSITLEDMLSCWARDPQTFARADRRMRAFLDPMINEAAERADGELIRLRELSRIWDMLAGQLMEPS